MTQTAKSWLAGNEKTDTPLAKKKLIAEIHRIANEKWPVPDKMREARYLIEQYFRIANNEEMLNANL